MFSFIAVIYVENKAESRVDKRYARVLFLESPEKFSGPKSQFSNCNPLVLKSWSFNMFLM